MNAIDIMAQTQKADGILAKPYHGLAALEAIEFYKPFVAMLGNDAGCLSQFQAKGKDLGYGK